MIQIGSLELTPDAFLFLISGLLLGLVLLMKYGSSMDIYLLLTGYIIGTYRVNCMITGNCNTFARFTAVASFILTGLIIMNLPKEKPQDGLRTLIN